MTDAPPFPDEIAEGVRAADPDALAVVFRTVSGPLAGWLRTQVADEHLVEDLIEDTFLDLVRGCRAIKGGPFAVRAWLYQAARRNLLDVVRGRSRRPEVVTDVVPEGPDDRDGPEAIVAQRDAEVRLRAHLSALAPDQEQVLTLRFLAGLTGPEVAAVLGKRQGAVRSLQHRGVAAFARRLELEAVPDGAPAAPQT